MFYSSSCHILGMLGLGLEVRCDKVTFFCNVTIHECFKFFLSLCMLLSCELVYSTSLHLCVM